MPWIWHIPLEAPESIVTLEQLASILESSQLPLDKVLSYQHTDPSVQADLELEKNTTYQFYLKHQR
jgi:hypothetical protein